MGAINNAFNQAAGTLAGAALVIQHAKETDFSKMNSADNSAMVARIQAKSATDEANAANDEAFKKGGLMEQLAEGDLNIEKAEKAYIKAKNRKNSSPKTTGKKFAELEAAEKAIGELNNKYQALQNIKDRAEEQRIYAAKATKMALDAKEKFEKRWGGTR